MRNVWIVFKRELKSYFLSPMAYVLLIIFVVLSIGIPFALANFIERNNASLYWFFYFHPWIYMVFGPAIGMRLWSEEHRMGTTELLLTMPVSPWQAITGKFLAATVVLATALLSTIGMVFTVNYLGDPDAGVMWSGYFGSLLVGMASIALTCAISAVTRNQITCLLISFTICFVLIMLGYPPVNDFLRGLDFNLLWFIPFKGGWLADIGNALSFTWHQNEMSRGLMRFQSVVYLASIIGYCLYLTSVIIRSKRS